MTDKEIKPYKGKYIRLIWKTNGFKHNCFGKLGKVGTKAFNFLIEEGEISIPLTYEQVVRITLDLEDYGI
jgi:hypothetical protein